MGTSFKYDVELGPRPKVRGSDSAPVKVIEFGDFQCRACGVVYKQGGPHLSALIDAGTVQVTFKHLAVGGQESAWAAEASECAADRVPSGRITTTYSSTRMGKRGHFFDRKPEGVCQVSCRRPPEI